MPPWFFPFTRLFGGVLREQKRHDPSGKDLAILGAIVFVFFVAELITLPLVLAIAALLTIKEWLAKFAT